MAEIERLPLVAAAEPPGEELVEFVDAEAGMVPAQRVALVVEERLPRPPRRCANLWRFVGAFRIWRALVGLVLMVAGYLGDARWWVRNRVRIWWNEPIRQPVILPPLVRPRVGRIRNHVVLASPRALGEHGLEDVVPLDTMAPAVIDLDYRKMQCIVVPREPLPITQANLARYASTILRARTRNDEVRERLYRYVYGVDRPAHPEQDGSYAPPQFVPRRPFPAYELWRRTQPPLNRNQRYRDAVTAYNAESQRIEADWRATILEHLRLALQSYHKAGKMCVPGEEDEVGGYENVITATDSEPLGELGPDFIEGGDRVIDPRLDRLTVRACNTGSKTGYWDDPRIMTLVKGVYVPAAARDFAVIILALLWLFLQVLVLLIKPSMWYLGAFTFALELVVWLIIRLCFSVPVEDLDLSSVESFFVRQRGNQSWVTLPSPASMVVQMSSQLKLPSPEADQRNPLSGVMKMAQNSDPCLRLIRFADLYGTKYSIFSRVMYDRYTTDAMAVDVKTARDTAREGIRRVATLNLPSGLESQVKASTLKAVEAYIASPK